MSKSISIPARTEKVKGKKQTSQVVQAMIEAFYVSAPRSAPVFRTIRSSHLTSSFLHRGFSYDYATT